ncbi:MAG: ATP phosphoribosyltransferase [Calditrichia bacterium]|nr:ATP phosphoribosyltransferase [Calditrichia bacterium]
MLTLAIQKSGRLNDATLKLLKGCGIGFVNGSKDKLKSTATNFPIKLLFLRDDDIPKCIVDKVADAGIVGENVYFEKGENLNISTKLGFAKCRLSIAIPKHFEYNSIKDLTNKRIATSHPKILDRFLNEKNIKADIHHISGSVEISPGIGLADAICDIISTGSTLLSNGLKEVDLVMKSEAVLISHPDLKADRKKVLNQLLFRLRAVKKAGNYKYILLNTPNDKIEQICEILPGMKSPTIMPLAEEGWSSLHSVIRENDFWEKINNLKTAGAQGILVIPIEKMIM